MASSTSGYRSGMCHPQWRQRPRSSIHPSRGRLSRAQIDSPHAGQREGGRTIDFPCGRREIQTLRKLPKASPKRTEKMAASRVTRRSIEPEKAFVVGSDTLCV